MLLWYRGATGLMLSTVVPETEEMRAMTCAPHQAAFIAVLLCDSNTRGAALRGC